MRYFWLWVALPWVLTIGFYFVRQALPLTWRRYLRPVDLMTLCLLVPIYVTLRFKYQLAAGSLILVLVMLAGMFSAFFLAWRRGEILFKTFFKFWWRLMFFVNVISYLGCLIGLIFVK